MTHVPLTLRHTHGRTMTGQPLDSWAVWVRYVPGIIGEVAKTWRRTRLGDELVTLTGESTEGGEWGWETVRRAA